MIDLFTSNFFYSLQASPLSSQIIQLRMSVSHLCFAPRVFLTSCNFDEQKSPSSSSWKQIVKFGCCFGLILMNFQKAQHLISSFDSIFFRANQCRPNEQGFNEERMSIKRGSLQLLIHHIFSCINCAAADLVFLHWERTKGGIKFSEKKSSLFFISQESPYLMPLA